MLMKTTESQTLYQTETRLDNRKYNVKTKRQMMQNANKKE